jgi:hypothetical protein
MDHFFASSRTVFSKAGIPPNQERLLSQSEPEECKSKKPPTEISGFVHIDR